MPAAFAAALGAWALYWHTSKTQPEPANMITTENPTENAPADLVTTVADTVAQVVNTFTPAPQDNPTACSPEGVDAIATREGFSAIPYPDHKGFSIGFGHLIKAGEDLPTVTREQALQLLASDVAWAQDAVAKAITVTITQSAFDALTSFCYNVGAGAFARSTLVKKINAGDSSAADEFSRWVFASGTKNAALVARRNDEAAQFSQA